MASDIKQFKIHIDDKQYEVSDNSIISIQTGKGKSAYKTIAECGIRRLGFVFTHYEGLNVHSGYKKRLILDGKIVHRVLS